MRKASIKTRPFDPAEHLRDESGIAAYLQTVLNDDTALSRQSLSLAVDRLQTHCNPHGCWRQRLCLPITDGVSPGCSRQGAMTALACVTSATRLGVPMGAAAWPVCTASMSCSLGYQPASQ